MARIQRTLTERQDQLETSYTFSKPLRLHTTKVRIAKRNALPTRSVSLSMTRAAHVLFSHS